MPTNAEPSVSSLIVLTLPIVSAAGGSQSNTDGGVVALTTPAALTMGSVNTIKLDTLGSAFVGMSVTFTPSLIGTTELKLQDVTLNATAAAGFTVTGMVFAFYNSTDLMNTAAIDTDFNQDSYSAYEMGTNLVGTTITPYTAGQYIALSFTSIVPAKGMPDMGGATAMCKDLTDFALFKQDLEGMNGMSLNCNNCHKAGGNGNSAFNMSGFTDNTMDSTSCATMLNYVTIATPNQSDVYLKVSGGKSHQGGTLSAATQTTFLAALTKWLNGEK
jgi:hypothetical protein